MTVFQSDQSELSMMKIFLFQTVKIFLFKLSKFPFSKCQKFPFPNCQNFPLKTVKIFLFKLSKFPFPNCQSLQGTTLGATRGFQSNVADIVGPHEYIKSRSVFLGEWPTVRTMGHSKVCMEKKLFCGNSYVFKYNFVVF
jgi:hypothetical protein